MKDSTPAIVYEGIEKNFGSLKVQGIAARLTEEKWSRWLPRVVVRVRFCLLQSPGEN